MIRLVIAHRVLSLCALLGRQLRCVVFYYGSSNPNFTKYFLPLTVPSGPHPRPVRVIAPTNGAPRERFKMGHMINHRACLRPLPRRGRYHMKSRYRRVSKHIVEPRRDGTAISPSCAAPPFFRGPSSVHWSAWVLSRENQHSSVGNMRGRHRPHSDPAGRWPPSDQVAPAWPISHRARVFLGPNRSQRGSSVDSSKRLHQRRTGGQPPDRSLFWPKK